MGEINSLLLEKLKIGLANHKGKPNAITSKEIVEKLKPAFPGINGATIRVHVHYLRTVEKVFICADSSGYYTPDNEIEAKHQLASIRSRIKELREVDIAQKEAYQKTFGQYAIDF